MSHFPDALRSFIFFWQNVCGSWWVGGIGFGRGRGKTGVGLVYRRLGSGDSVEHKSARVGWPLGGF